MQALKRTDRKLSKKRLLLLAAVAVLGLAGRADAQTIVRVEEEWEMMLGTPDSESDSPQVTTTMSPLGHIDGSYFTFELNHQSMPNFSPGGCHLHVWSGEDLVDSSHEHNGVTLNTANEHVQWTQAMSVVDGQLIYEVINGSSQTWPQFGETIQVSVATSLTDLSAYDPDVSLLNSGAGYGSNRVLSLRLKKVKLIDSNGDSIELAVNQDILPSG